MAPQPPNPAVSPVVPGTVLAGKYRVERIIGQGGMGLVVEARHIALDERIALKFLLPEYASHPEASQRFLREARAAVKIKSEHVARVSDVGTLESGAPYMVMEFLQGQDLSHMLETEGRLDITDAVEYVIQGAEALAEAHAYGIVHRDVKPANLFITRRMDGSPLVKVLDFGISKVMGNVDNLTKTTAAMGSALYMSPEQMQQTKAVDHRTDVYALGISLYELLAGKQPFYADTLPQLCAEILTGTPTPLREARPDVPDALAAIIEKAYARDRNFRYQSIAEFVVALAAYAPPRVLGTVERIAKASGVPFIPGQPPQAPHPGYGTNPNAMQAPVAHPGYGTNPNAQLAPGTNPGFANAPPNHPLAGSSPNVQVAGNVVLPGPYRGPASTRAAANFASGSTQTGMATTGPLQGGSNRAALVVALAVGALALVGIVVLLLTRGQPPPPAQAAAPTTAAPAAAPSAEGSAVPSASASDSPAESATAAPESPTAETAEPPARPGPRPGKAPPRGKSQPARPFDPLKPGGRNL